MPKGRTPADEWELLAWLLLVVERVAAAVTAEGVPGQPGNMSGAVAVVAQFHALSVLGLMEDSYFPTAFRDYEVRTAALAQQYPCGKHAGSLQSVVGGVVCISVWEGGRRK